MLPGDFSGVGIRGCVLNEVSFFIELFKAVAVAIATWAALKVEIAAARMKADHAKESADEAHKRIDIHLEKGH